MIFDAHQRSESVDIILLRRLRPRDVVRAEEGALARVQRIMAARADIVRPLLGRGQDGITPRPRARAYCCLRR